MWLYNYFSLMLLTFLINCNLVENNGPKEKIDGNIYVAKNIVPSQIKRKFLEIMKYVILKKPIIIGSKRKHNTKEQDIELTGAIVILQKVKNDKHEKSSGERTTKINHTTYRKKPGNQKNIVRFRKNNLKIVMAIIDNRIKRDSVVRKGLSIENSRDSVPKTTMTRLTPNILRDKYGDACIKVAIRKCYKALLAVNKNICKARYRCKSSFRSYFKKMSKVGCIKEFDYTKKNVTYYIKFRDSTFVDATREGYLDACIPYMVSNYKVQRRTITLRNDTLANVFQNVLRKGISYKKCQRLSRVKCYRACCFALQETCSKYNCSSRRKRISKKTCKEQCKRGYQIIRTSDSSETSSGSD